MQCPNKSKTGAQALINKLKLEPHIEGGYFRRTFAATHRDKIPTPNGKRATISSILYLLCTDSAIGYFHRNQSDILHFFHDGDPLTYYLIHPNGALETVVLGRDLNAGQQLQLSVKGGVWKASELCSVDTSNKSHGYGLISEAVAPGFDYRDMQLAARATLCAEFPQHRAYINRLTRDPD